MNLKEIKDKKLILVDSLDVLNENKVNYNNTYVVTFLPDNTQSKFIVDFYSLINKDLQKYYVEKLDKIVEEFHNSLNINLALKKNITRLVYGQIGVFPFFHVIYNLLSNNNKINVYTKDQKIYEIIKYFNDDKNLSINFLKKNKNNFSNVYKINKFQIFKILNFNEIKFLIKKKYYPPFKKLKNLKKNVFIHLSTEPNFRIVDNYLNSKWQSKLLEIDVSKKEIEDIEVQNNSQFLNISNSINIIVKNYFFDNKFFYNYLNFESEFFFKKYIFFYNKIEKIFENLNSNFFLLCKIIRSPLITALYDFGKKKNKNFFWISHQHGHGIELSKIHKKSEITKEETLADLLFVYSPIGKKKRYKNNFIKSNTKISEIGYWNKNKILNTIPDHKILYVSNLNQEIGPHEINMSSLSNTEKIKFETELITNIFSKIKHKVLFKDYPGSKSSELKNNHFKKISKSFNNIIYFDKWLNVENMYGKSSIIITSLPTSGIASAININKPLVYINIEKMIPLDVEVKKNFKKFFFYFEFDENLNYKLSNFLSKEIKEIESLWYNKMTNEREDFIKSFFNIMPQEEVIKKLKGEISNIFVNN